MCVAKRHVGNGDVSGIEAVDGLILGDGDVRVGERRAANGAKMIQLNYHPLARIVKIGDGLECLPLALLRALSVAGVKQRDVSIAVRL
jgi:hypothetical protein